MSVLGLHVRADGVTAVMVDAAGDVAASAHVGLHPQVPRPGWVEQAPEAIWRATVEATQRVLRGTDRDGVVALGLTTERDSLVLWDRETLGSPRPAILRGDLRATEACDRWRVDGHEERVVALTGQPPGPGHLAPRLRWVAEHEPHTWAHVADGTYAVGTLDSYLVARLTRGVHHVTDVSHASRTLLLDLASGRWSAELCGVLAVPGEALPDLVPSWSRVGTTDARSFCGLSVPVAGLAEDRSAALVGHACFDERAAAGHLGDGSFVLTHTGPVITAPIDGATPTAAWRSPDGRLTYAAGLDEPLTRHPLPGPPTSVRVGGTPTDDALCQRLADRSGVPVEQSTSAEPAARGAALLAGLGAGVWSSVEALRGLWRPGRRFEPAGHE